MSIATLRGWAGVIISLGFFSGIDEIAAAEPVNPTKAQVSSVEDLDKRLAEKWAAAAKQTFDWDYQDTKLSEVIEDIASRIKIPLKIDVNSLAKAGVQPDVPVTFRAKNLSAGAALRFVLEEVQLTWQPAFGQMVIRNQDYDDGLPKLRKLYLIADLLPNRGDWESESPAEALKDLITTMIDDASWSDVGGPYSIEIVEWSATPQVAALSIQQSLQNHEQIEQLLRGLRRVKHSRPTEPSEIPASIDISGIDAVRQALDRKESRKVNSTLEMFAATIAEASGKNVIVPRRDLDEIGVPADSLLINEYTDLPLHAALDAVLREVHATYYVTPEAIVFSNPDVVARPKNQCRRIFPVYDLVAPEGAKRTYELTALIELIQKQVDDHSWSDVGGPADIAIWDSSALVVSTTAQNLLSIEQLLTELRSSRAMAPKLPLERNDKDLYVYRVFDLTASEFSEESKSTRLVELPADEVAKLVRIVQKTVAPESWQKPEVQMDVWKNRLVVRQRPEVLAEMDSLFKRLGIIDRPTSGGGFCGGYSGPHLAK